MCIYYGTKEGLTYTSGEHIFPATIGGIEKLPIGFVSDQANNYFSKLESRIITSSFLGISKSFFGPGKRGKKKPGRLPINLISEQNTEYIGYTFYGKPHQIAQIIVKEDIREIKITRDYYFCTQNDIEKLFKKIREFDERYTYIDAKLQCSHFIIGLYENRLYIIAKNKNKINDFINYIRNHIDKIDYDYTQEKLGTINKPTNLIQMEVSTADARVFAKTAINVIAKVKGIEYLNNPMFDNFKNWILGEPNTNFEQLPRNEKVFPLELKESNMHYCILININGLFVAFVTFYNYWTMAFEICKKFDSFFNYPYILFCDWENKQEYNFLETIIKDLED